jgi:hypothetical protein
VQQYLVLFYTSIHCNFVVTIFCTLSLKVRCNLFRHNGTPLLTLALPNLLLYGYWRVSLLISWDIPDPMTVFWTPLPRGTSFHPLPSRIYFTFCMTPSELPTPPPHPASLSSFAFVTPPSTFLSSFPTYLFFLFSGTVREEEALCAKNFSIR